MNAHAVLREVRALLMFGPHARFGGWSATCSVSNAGHICSPHAEEVARYSLHDAVEVASKRDVDLIIEVDALLTVLAEPGHRRTLYDWEMEPTRTLRDVLELVDRGIMRAALLALGGRS